MAIAVLLAGCGDDQTRGAVDAATSDAQVADARAQDAAAPDAATRDASASDATADDSALRDAAPADARSSFPPIPAGAVACTHATAANCNQNRSDFACFESDFGNGWVREDVLNLDCPNGSAAMVCGGSATQPFVVSLIRLCHAGGTGQNAPCPDGRTPPTGPNGCAVCENTSLTCL
jgi:hypothetical protein